MSPNIFKINEIDKANLRLNYRKNNELRTCKKCNENKLLSNFSGHIIKHHNSICVTFLSSCKKCGSHKNILDVKIARKRDPVYSRACKYWTKSIQKGIRSDLKLYDIRSMLSKQCYYCECSDSIMTLDRKNNNGGYTKNNAVPCCFRCNTLKSDMPLKAWEYMTNAVRHAAKLGLFENWRANVPKKFSPYESLTINNIRT